MESSEAKNCRSRFNSLYKECEDIYRCSAKFLNMSECAMWVLSVLSELKEPPTQAELCAQLSQPKQTINSNIAVLEKRGIVELVPVSRNRKEKQVVLTEKGMQYVNEKIRPFVRVEEEIFAEMGTNDSHEYLRLMQKYIAIYRKKMEHTLKSLDSITLQSPDEEGEHHGI